MKSYLALAWKELKAQKITAILILVAVIMSTIMTTVIGQSIGILQSMRIQQAAGLNGNRYATFHQLGKEQAQKLHEDDRLYDVGDTIFIGSTPLGNSSLSLYLREYHDNALSMYPAIGNVKEGRLPEEAIEIALSEDALQYLGLDAVIGDTVSLDLSVSVMDGSLSELEYSADFVLTGILEAAISATHLVRLRGLSVREPQKNCCQKSICFIPQILRLMTSKIFKASFMLSQKI